MILVSTLGPNTSYLLFGGTFIQLGGLLGQGLGLGPGLDNKKQMISVGVGGCKCQYPGRKKTVHEVPNL